MRYSSWSERRGDFLLAKALNQVGLANHGLCRLDGRHQFGGAVPAVAGCSAPPSPIFCQISLPPAWRSRAAPSCSLSRCSWRARKIINLAIKKLKEHNFINIQKDGRGNMYFVNANLVWKSYGTNHKFAEFNVKIIFSQEEIQKMNFKNTLLKKGQNIISGSN